MKIAIKDLNPNPYRKIDSYPINEEKVKSLMASIQDTDFWDNIVVRKKDGKFEIAYGHHRLEALKRLNWEEADLPVKNLSDQAMIQIMANENLEVWETDANVIRETVKVAKEYLGDNPPPDKPHVRKDQGIGKDTIAQFLGGVWNQEYGKRLIKEALAELRDINEGIIEEEDISSITSQETIKEIRKTVREIKSLPKSLPKTKVKEIVRSTVKRVTAPPQERIGIKEIRNEMIGQALTKKEKGLPNIDTYCRKTADKITGLFNELDMLKPYIDQIRGIDGDYFWNSIDALDRALKPFIDYRAKGQKGEDYVDV